MKTLPILALLAFLFAALGIAGCDVSKGPAEKAGENIDDAIDKTGDAMEDAMEDAGDEIRDKTQ